MRYASFLPFLLLKVLMLPTSQLLHQNITLFPIHVYIFICIYPYPRSSTRGFIPNNCMLSSKTLNICTVYSFKSNYAKYRRGSGSKTSSRGFVIVFVNACSMIPRPEDDHDQRSVKKTVYIWGTCVRQAPHQRYDVLFSSCLTPISGFSSRQSSVCNYARLVTTSFYARSTVSIRRRL